MERTASRGIHSHNTHTHTVNPNQEFYPGAPHNWAVGEGRENKDRLPIMVEWLYTSVSCLERRHFRCYYSHCSKGEKSWANKRGQERKGNIILQKIFGEDLCCLLWVRDSKGTFNPQWWMSVHFGQENVKFSNAEGQKQSCQKREGLLVQWLSLRTTLLHRILLKLYLSKCALVNNVQWWEDQEWPTHGWSLCDIMLFMLFFLISTV